MGWAATGWAAMSARTHSSSACDEWEHIGLPSRERGIRSSTRIFLGIPLKVSFTRYLPAGLYIGMPRRSCGKMMLVISCLRNLRSYAAAMTKEDTNEQSVMMVCVMLYDETCLGGKRGGGWSGDAMDWWNGVGRGGVGWTGALGGLGCWKVAQRRGAMRCGYGCDAMWCGVVWCGAVRSGAGTGAMRCGVVWCGAARRGAVRWDTVR